mgnify:CR=1 FL=1
MNTLDDLRDLPQGLQMALGAILAVQLILIVAALAVLAQNIASPFVVKNRLLQFFH